MSEFNSCAHLLNEKQLTEAKEFYKSILSKNEDPLKVMMEMQKSLQDKLANSLGRIPLIEDIKTKGQLYDWLTDQKMAIDDEFRELIDAVAGMEKSEKDRSAIWKKWKANHDNIRNELISDLSDFEKKELLFEAVDLCHFWINILLSLGITPEQLFMLYFIKNEENFNRQKRGY